MILGIPYHVSLAYRPDHPWMVDAEQGGNFTIYFADVIHVFRMPAFFVIAGYFTAMILTRRDLWTWFSGRAVRLRIPFIVSLLTLVPLMNAIASSFATGDFNSSALDDAYMKPGSTWVRHLWFLWVLFAFQGLTALTLTLKPSLRTAILKDVWDSFYAKHFQVCLIITSVAIGIYELLAVGAFYKAHLDTPIFDGILRSGDFLFEAPFFIAGFVLNRSARTKNEFLKPQIMLTAFSFVALDVTPWFSSKDD